MAEEVVALTKNEPAEQHRRSDEQISALSIGPRPDLIATDLIGCADLGGLGHDLGRLGLGCAALSRGVEAHR